MTTAKKTTKKTTPKKTPKKTGVISEHEKEVVIKELKETMHQMGRLPKLIMAPIIMYIGKKYNKLPKERRKQLHNITKDMKEHSDGALDKLKERFQSIARHDKVTSTKKGTKTRKTTRGKTARSKKKTSPSTIQQVKTTAKKTSTSVKNTASKTVKNTEKVAREKVKEAKKTTSTKAKPSKKKTTKKKAPTKKSTTKSTTSKTTKKK